MAASHFVIFGSLCLMVLARPTEIDDIFAEYSRIVNLYNSEKRSHIVKRRIYEDNQDVGSEKVSLKSIIGDLEQNFIKSASGVANIQSQSKDDDEKNPIFAENHSILKRKTENTKSVDIIPHKEENVNSGNKTTTELIETTTDNISTMEVKSTRMYTSLISLESHYGDLPAVPGLDVNQSTLKDGNSDATQQVTHTTTKTKTNEHLKEIPEKNGNNDQTKTSHHYNNRVTEQYKVGTVATTTAPQKNAEELKESEAELKEKVAEIEAEPVILSARV